MLNKLKNVIVEGANQRPILLDITCRATGTPKPVVLFWHGFKGFKDWGCWSLISEQFARSGFVFIACNFSHNGTTPEALEEFGDLEAFGQNNFSKELYDIDAVVNWLTGLPADIPNEEMDLSQIHLIGHSRGGGICIIHAAKDTRIKRLITWASVSRLDYSWRQHPELVSTWRETGVHYILNGRTNQQMPLYFQLYEDFMSHENDYDIPTACRQMEQPLLVIHGTEDPAVPVSAAKNLADWHPTSELVLIEGASHVFGGQHPFEAEDLPAHAKKLVEKSIEFLIKEST